MSIPGCLGSISISLHKYFLSVPIWIKYKESENSRRNATEMLERGERTVIARIVTFSMRLTISRICYSQTPLLVDCWAKWPMFPFSKYIGKLTVIAEEEQLLTFLGTRIGRLAYLDCLGRGWDRAKLCSMLDDWGGEPAYDTPPLEAWVKPRLRLPAWTTILWEAWVMDALSNPALITVPAEVCIRTRSPRLSSSFGRGSTNSCWASGCWSLSGSGSLALLRRLQLPLRLGGAEGATGAKGATGGGGAPGRIQKSSSSSSISMAEVPAAFGLGMWTRCFSSLWTWLFRHLENQPPVSNCDLVKRCCWSLEKTNIGVFLTATSWYSFGMDHSASAPLATSSCFKYLHAWQQIWILESYNCRLHR